MKPTDFFQDKEKAIAMNWLEAVVEEKTQELERLKEECRYLERLAALEARGLYVPAPWLP